MNRNPLSRTPIASRLQALFAAAAVTLAMLAGIDGLTGGEAPLHMAGAAAIVVNT